MKLLAAIALYALVTHAIFALGYRRLELAWTLPWLVLDCIASVAIKERFGATLSAKAWDARNHPRWWWTHHAIDAMPFFGAEHCRIQYERELHYGGVWNSWAAEWRGEVFKLPQAAQEG